MSMKMRFRKLLFSLAIGCVSLIGIQQPAVAATSSTTILLDGYPLPFGQLRQLI